MVRPRAALRHAAARPARRPRSRHRAARPHLARRGSRRVRRPAPAVAARRVGPVPHPRSTRRADGGRQGQLSRGRDGEPPDVAAVVRRRRARDGGRARPHPGRCGGHPGVGPGRAPRLGRPGRRVDRTGGAAHRLGGDGGRRRRRRDVRRRPRRDGRGRVAGLAQLPAHDRRDRRRPRRDRQQSGRRRAEVDRRADGAVPPDRRARGIGAGSRPTSGSGRCPCRTARGVLADRRSRSAAERRRRLAGLRGCRAPIGRRRVRRGRQADVGEHRCDARGDAPVHEGSAVHRPDVGARRSPRGDGRADRVGVLRARRPHRAHAGTDPRHRRPLRVGRRVVPPGGRRARRVRAVQAGPVPGDRGGRLPAAAGPVVHPRRARPGGRLAAR